MVLLQAGLLLLQSKMTWTPLFFIWSNSKLLFSGMQEYWNMYSFKCQKLLIVSKYTCACVCSNSLKSLSQLKTQFMLDHHGIGEKIYSNDSGQLLLF